MEFILTLIGVLGTLYGLYELLFLRIEVQYWIKYIFLKELRFSYRRIEKEIAKLDKQIKKTYFRPSKIIGVGGGTSLGGFIVGAMLASRKYMDIPFIPLDIIRPGYVPDPTSLKIVVSQLTNGDKILLVDDIVKKGDTVVNTITELEKHGISRANIKVAAIVSHNEELVRVNYPGRSALLDNSFWEDNFCAYIVQTSKIRFPWHV